MLIDMTRCIGCDACTVACKQENGTPADVFFARVLNIESGHYPNVKRMYLPILCNHCDDAPCLKSCPNKAIVRRQDGIVLIDQDRCRGTGACVSACPYGNIYLNKKDEWYLDQDEPYEKDFVKPRLEENVARKCTYCAHRVDEGLDPACVVACPTDARIFGDIEDPESKISKYIVEQEEQTGREPFYLLPEAGTKPAGMYLGPMARQESHTGGNRASSEGTEPISHTSRLPEERRQGQSRDARAFLNRKMTLLRIATAVMALMVACFATAQSQMEPAALKIYTDSACSNCHGDHGQGDYGPAINVSKMSQDDFMKIVRKGVGDDMPETSAEEMSDADVIALYKAFKGAGTKVEKPTETPTEKPTEKPAEQANVQATPMEPNALKAYKKSPCSGCHGDQGQGGYGPAIDTSKLSEAAFMKIVRKGVGNMPETASDELSDEDALAIYQTFHKGPLQVEKPEPMEPATAGDAYTLSTCTGCHGVTGNGGIGPPLAGIALTEDQFLSTVRSGKGMMPGTPASVLPDETVKQIYKEFSAKKVNEDEVPISFKVGRFLSTQNVGRLFLFIFIIAAIFGFNNLFYWLRAAGLKQLRPYIAKFGRVRAAGVVVKALIVEGLGVASLFRKDKFRWAMHGLLIYGFFGLMAADIWMQIVNPARSDMSMVSGPKLLAVIAGVSVFLGLCYVLYRYKKDEYIDNGMTLGKDFLFVNLLFHTIISGFLTVAINKSGANDWLMTVYIYHLASISLLILTAPFTRFMHVWVAPSMVAMTRLVEEITASGVDIGFEREPSPGRHHKSQRIAAQIVSMFDPEANDEVKVRYYP